MQLRRLTLIALAAGSIAGAGRIADAERTAEQALARAAGLFADGATRQTRFTQVYTPAGFRLSRTETGRLLLRKPSSARFEYDGDDRKVFTFDGRTARFYSPVERQIIVRRLSDEERAKLPLVFFESPAKLSAAYRIETGDGGSIRLVPISPGEISRIELGFSADGFPASLAYTVGNGDRTELKFSAFSAASADQNAFTINPPAGTRVVDAGSSE